jgi:hypothetical protein
MTSRKISDVAPAAPVAAEQSDKAIDAHLRSQCLAYALQLRTSGGGAAQVLAIAAELYQWVASGQMPAPPAGGSG